MSRAAQQPGRKRRRVRASALARTTRRALSARPVRTSPLTSEPATRHPAIRHPTTCIFCLCPARLPASLHK